MKKQIVLIAMTVFAFIGTANAQGGGYQRRTVEERVKTVHEKLDSAFKLPADKMIEIDVIFTDFYRATDKTRDDMMASGSFDRDAMREKNMEFATARDEKLKKLLTEDQMKIWKESIEPTTRPQRGQRPQGQ